ncbi:TolC family protein [uncultured Methylibium sp.]|uniref:TolC family protein n=1 Tax=uncultured Methylibium sp. TaxID=381093 RepID=UPI0025E1677B|nr:TolC family protein [uncultured Methylibium sp.]
MKQQGLAGIVALLIGTAAAAQGVATPRDLPSTELAVAWIDKDPAVIEARRALAAAGHGAAVLAAGPYEWTANASTQRRNVGGVGNTTEWSVGVERGIRIGGKAGLDRQLGDADIETGRARVGDARREVARALSDLWLDLQAAHGAQALLKEQLSFVESNLAAVDKRKRAGDASALDLSIAQSDLAEVRRQASQADSALAKARAKLKLRFPEASLAPGAFSDPTDPPWPEARWRERILSGAGPLKVAEAQLRRAELAASRTRADKVADPTVGVFTSNEAFRNERVVGISVSIPFGGTARERRLQQSLQEVEVARAALDRTRQGIEIQIAETFSDAVGGVERWRIAERGAEAARESARLTQRAYTLGEVDLQSLLLVRRQSLDALRAAGEARAEALRWNYRLLIDAQLVWDLAND